MSAVGAGAGEPMPETQLELEAEYAAAEAAGAGAPPPRPTSSRHMAASPAVAALEDVMWNRGNQQLLDDFYKYFAEGNPENLLQFEVPFLDLQNTAKELVPEEYTEGRGGLNCSILCLIALGVVDPTEDILSRCKARGTGTPFMEIRSILGAYLKPCSEKPFRSADMVGPFEPILPLLNELLLPGHATIVNIQGKYSNSEPFTHTVLVSNIAINRKKPRLVVLDPQMIDEEGKYPFTASLDEWAKVTRVKTDYIWAMLGPTVPAATLAKCPKTTEYPAMDVGGRRKTRKRKHRRRKTHRRRR